MSNFLNTDKQVQSYVPSNQQRLQEVMGPSKKQHLTPWKTKSLTPSVFDRKNKNYNVWIREI